MTTKVFAYGSIYEGMVHFNRLLPLIASKKEAWTRGQVYRLKVGYPVLLKNGQDLVPGQVLDLKRTDFLMNIIDEFHGYNPNQPEKSLYLREETPLLDHQGQAVETGWVYYLNPKKLPANAELIEGGNWLKDFRKEEILSERLTERQRHYIQKLGAASGRDIVPINDISLYRELLGLELIVDKGRRLALSKLGQEVYRYLE